MNLTSWQRLRHMIGGNTPLKDDAINKRRFLNYIPAISRRIEEFLNRDLEIVSHTEYFDVLPLTSEYFTQSFPITTITSLESDSTGLYEGSETSEVDYYTGKNATSIVLDTSATPSLKGLKIVYTSGLATSGTKSQYTLENLGAQEPVVGNYIEGNDTGSMAIVSAWVAGTKLLTIDLLYGIFDVGESFTLRATETGTAIVNGTGDIASKDVLSLAETYTDIVTACELEIRYMDDNRSSFETQANFRNQQTKVDMTRTYDLLPEVRSLLEPYRNISI